MNRYETLYLDRDGGAATLVLNRPEVMNAWNRQMVLELRAAIEEVSEDETIRALCITGAGRAFSTGGDLKDLRASQDLTDSGRPDVYRSLKERNNPLILGIREMPKPVIAAVNGVAAGIGVSLALAADFVIAKSSARFILAFTQVGIALDGGASAFLCSRIGLNRATELAMLGEPISSGRATELGLITRAVPDEEFEDEIAALLRRLATGPTAAYAGLKRQLNSWVFDRLDSQLELEAQVQRDLVETDDWLEGTTAFVEKRDPSFRGR
jgi:2-(1,2-epoxy-1,2-dihydrophenyl)acetyl-CoA isomerase